MSFFQNLMNRFSDASERENDLSAFVTEREFNGITESELDEIAKSLWRGISASIDNEGNVIFVGTSRSGKARFTYIMEVDDAGFLHRPPVAYYPGQWKDAADEFAHRVNEVLRMRY